MKILHISATDIQGGAARAAFRLHEALLELGHESYMLVGRKSSTDKAVIEHNKGRRGLITWKVRRKLDKMPLKKYRNKAALFSVNWLPDTLLARISAIKPDVVHIHWVGGGFLSLRSLKKLEFPTVWTFHDMWPLTGGCHYSGDCDRFKSKCGSCPIIGSSDESDISTRQQGLKKHAITGKNLSVITPSRWLAKCAAESSIFRENQITTIPYNLNLTTYKSTGQQQARELLNLPLDKKIILFGAMSATSDRRKGFVHLIAALKELPKEMSEKINILVYGADSTSLNNDISNPIHYAGIVKDEEKLVTCYSAADIFVAPSLEDNLPLTVMEALACSTPVVAFDIGGMADMVSHRENGYLAKPFDTVDLRQGILWTLQNSALLRQAARAKAQNLFDSRKIVDSHLVVYGNIL